MILWHALAEAAAKGLPASRVAVVEGPLQGTQLVLGPHGEVWERANPTQRLGPDLAPLARESLTSGRLRLHMVGECRVFVEPVLPPPRLLIFGAGHVAMALAPAALLAGFRVAIIDDRPEFARPERFPGASVVQASPAEAVEQLHPGDTTFMVLAGRSHELDRQTLAVVLQQPAAYVGMVGSRRKAAELQRQLVESGEAKPWALEQLRAPIGLDLGAETPAEIAVSILAEMIAVWRGGSGLPISQGARRGGTEAGVPAGTVESAAVWDALGAALRLKEPCVLATITLVKGSTPRSAGACFVLTAGGELTGSVGGGYWEAEVMKAGQECLRTGQPILLRPDYVDSGDMICGGTAEVFVEPVGVKPWPS